MRANEAVITIGNHVKEDTIVIQNNKSTLLISETVYCMSANRAYL